MINPLIPRCSICEEEGLHFLRREGLRADDAQELICFECWDSENFGLQESRESQELEEMDDSEEGLS